MPLSRLDNFLKNVRGNIIYVSPNDLDATDSIENRGNSMGRPFITIQRALLEASRFSYQQGLDNDRYGKTTICLGPGEHVIDNRPGWIPDGTANFRLRNGTTSDDFPTLTTASNFDITTSNNILYKLNSIHGGVIIPRGISLVGTDLRKVKVRPLYVPDPVNDNIERSSLWKITGGSYFLQVTMFDGDPNGQVYKNYNTDKYVPNFSHHKLTCFEFVDGVNDVDIADTFQTYKTDRTDLEMYYEKVGLLYGTATGRAIEPDYPSSGLDIQPKVDEYRIVGPTGGQIEITSIKSGDGVIGSKIITVSLAEALNGLNVDTAFQIRGVNGDYNGQYVVQEVLTTSNLGTTSFTYQVSNIPAVLQPAVTAAVVELDINTIVGASPYIFNCSFRSVYGMCGVHADGSKASGFKSMVISQFTGVSLQKDNNAFVRFDSTSGSFKDSSTIDNIHSNPSGKYKPAYYNHHIKASNNAVLQVVSIFAVGFSHHFVSDDGGDYSITNSNSNFGQTSLYGKGFRNNSFSRDDVGYITNIIPPKENVATNITLEYGSIDVSTTVGIASTSRLYLYGETNEASPPPSVLQGYRVGAKSNDKLSVGIGTIAYDARIIMSDTEKNVGIDNQISSVKESVVLRSSGINDISDSTVTFTANHEFANGESIRVVSDNARLPDGLKSNVIYYAISDGLAADKLKIASTLTDATNLSGVTFNSLGGVLTVESRVSDKNCGDIGHPVQYDSGQSQWFVGVATDNEIYPKVIVDGTAGLGNATARTYITRKPDTRSIEDKIYKVRFVIPSSAGITTARAPRENYIIQESSDVTGATNSEVALLYSSDASSTLSNSNQLRNFSFLRDANWVSGGTAYYTSEIPHKLSVGSQVKILNVTSTNNVTGVANSSYNGTFSVVGITSACQFYVTGMSADPGTFTNNTSVRNTSLPTLQRVRSKYNFYVYDSEQISEYKQGEQDGIYSLTVLDASHTPDVSPFNDSATFSYPAPISNLYPQYDRDNPNSNPSASISYAVSDPLGQVVIDNPKNSITRGAIDKVYWDYGVGIGITDIVSQTGTGNTVTIYTDIPHGLNRITNMSITSAGAGYGTTLGLAQSLYNVSVGLVTETNGIDATARISVDTSGSVTSLKIMEGGTNYSVGDILSITGTATTTGFTTATATITAIGNNSGDTLRIAGVTSTNYEGYNQLYRITGITTTKAITAVGVNTISNGSTTGIGVTLLANAYGQITGSQLTVVGGSVEYNGTVGILTVVTSQAHGLRVNNNITIGSSSGGNYTELYNREMIVTKVNSLTEFESNIGVSTLTPTFTGTIYGYYPGLAAQSGTITPTDEQYGGRVQNIYAGITTSVGGSISATDVSITINNALNYNFNIGDYLRIDDEILRIKKVVTSPTVSVFRGLYGTNAAAHDDDSVVRTIGLPPIELRRPSTLRASSHTFEYLGYGAGNYSTALPQVQSDQPTFEEQILAQSITSGGGLTVYTGMDSSGDYYVGNKRISASSGKEEIYNSPVPTITGEDVTNPSILSTDNVDASRRIVVDGGTDGDILSEFNGPVLFSKKITSTSDEGIEASSFKIQGDATISRKYTVGIATPTTAGNVGDVVYNSEPVKDGTLGWVYTTDNGWYPFGKISIGQTSSKFNFNRLGIATDSYGDNTFQVGSGTSIFSVDGYYGVGIGTTSDSYRLNVKGNTNFIGIVTASYFYGDATYLSNVPSDSLWTNPSLTNNIIVKGDGSNDSADFSVGIGTSIGLNSTLTVGTNQEFPAGITTSLMVHNRSNFIGTADFAYEVNIAGITSISDFQIDYSSLGRIRAGIVTSADLVIGTSGTVLTTDSTNSYIGLGTATPREKIDLSERTRMSSYYEAPYTVTSSSGVVLLDLSKAQSFQLTTTEAVTQFTLSKAKANMSTTFTIKITQDSSTAYTAGWTFKDDSGTTLTVKWPGGVAPTLTSSVSAIDIYSFITMDGGTNLYGVIGGQNFS